MGLCTFKSRRTGAIVRAEWPLQPFPELVQVLDEHDALVTAMAPVDFANEYAQVLPELPAANAETIPEVPADAAFKLEAPRTDEAITTVEGHAVPPADDEHEPGL